MKLVDKNDLNREIEKNLYWTDSQKAAIRNVIHKTPTIDPESLRPQWIPVTERLPDRKGLKDDEAEYVLVAEFFNITENHYVSICAYDKDGWSKWDSFGNVRPEQITHWMPLPAPPVNEQKGDADD